MIFSPNNMADDKVFNLLIKTEGEIESELTMRGEADDSSDDSVSGSLIDLPSTTTTSHSPLIPGSSTLRGREFTLPEPSNQSLPIVAGYIVSIMKILDAMDQRFTAVLTQSMQGLSKV